MPCIRGGALRLVAEPPLNLASAVLQNTRGDGMEGV